MLFSDYLIAIMLLRRSVCSFVAQRSVASIIELFSLYYFWLYSNIWLINKRNYYLLLYSTEIMFDKRYITLHHVPAMVVEFGLCHLFNLNVIYCFCD